MNSLPSVLFVATVEIHILTFHLPYLKYFYDQGYEVHVACAGNSDIPYCHVKHSIPFERSPFRLSNIKSLFMLKAIMDKNQYALIHCHTPVGGVIGRLAAVGARKKDTRVLYTAHGFQFYKGGPVKDWIIYYTVEKIMARFTDVLITINQEDYDVAIQKKFKAKEIKKIDGIGLEIEKFQVRDSSKSIEDIKKSIGLDKEDFILLCVGELNKNKNQMFLLEVIKNLRSDKDLSSPIKLVLAGSGIWVDLLKIKVKELGIAEYVIFLGYRNDIPELLSMTDIAVSASLREGLPFNLLEAMAAGKPVVATDVRGHRDLVKNGVNGFLVKQGNKTAFVDAIKKLYYNKELCHSFGQEGALMSLNFSLDRTMTQMMEIYRAILDIKR